MEDFDVVSLFLNFLITLVIYMFVPIILLLSKKELSEDEPKKIAIINSVGGFIIFVILFIILNRDINLLTGSPAFVYGYINYKLLLKLVKKEKQKYPDEEKETEELNNLINRLEKEKKSQ